MRRIFTHILIVTFLHVHEINILGDCNDYWDEMFAHEISSGGLVETKNERAPQAINPTEQVQESSGFSASVCSENFGEKQATLMLMELVCGLELRHRVLSLFLLKISQRFGW